MVDNYKDIFQKKKIIKFKLLLYYFHSQDGEKRKLKSVADEAETTKSEVTKGIAALVEEGLLEKDDSKNVHLTESGRRAAEEYHRNYQTAVFCLQKSFEPDMVKIYAEKIAMQFDTDEIMKIFSTGVFAKKYSDKLAEYHNLDGKLLCELLGNGNFTVPFKIDPVFNPTSPMYRKPDEPSLEAKLADFWRRRSKEVAEERKAGINTEDNNALPQEKSSDFERFFTEIVGETSRIFFQKYLNYKEIKNVSMADEAFIHPAICQISDHKGHIKLHRQTIKKTGMRGTTMTCKAEFLKYYNGEEFVECPFTGDDVDVPMEHFKFTRYGDVLIGKLLLQFKAECDVLDMPVSVAELVVSFYPF